MKPSLRDFDPFDEQTYVPEQFISDKEITWEKITRLTCKRLLISEEG